MRIAYKVGPLPTPTTMTQIPVVQNRMELDVTHAKEFEDAVLTSDGKEADLVFGWLDGILRPIIKSLFPNTTIARTCGDNNCLYPKAPWYPQSAVSGTVHIA